MHSEVCGMSISVSTVFFSQAVRGLLDNPNEPVSELSYFDCIESVMENSKVQVFKNNCMYQTFKPSAALFAAEEPILPNILHLQMASGARRVHGRYFSALQDG